ncbi:addiction module antitoxin, RelB/DinJ family [[Eubacterium] yurii subsp. margaretiae ATCC 43715]|nr:addiction module antitoxin, RelB/DinJ family [[Eubacterium] yurii subsp. margaretiae ATCC 43715]
MIIMATIPTQIRIDSDIKKQANNLFNELGMDISGAVNIFLRQCILHGGLPFAIELPRYNYKTLEAMAEARRISRDPDTPSYSSMNDLREALLSD